MNLTSESIQVFPISTPRIQFPSDRILLESNLINFIKGYTDREGFVISTSYSPSQIFEFILHGYYCKILPQSDMNSPFTTSKVYACILVEKSGTSCLIGRDQEDSSTKKSVYKAVQFVSDLSNIIDYDEDTQDLYSLLILEKIGDVYTIPRDSFIKFDNRSVNISTAVIDGGTI